MLRKYQLSSAKLKELYELRKYSNEELIYYFGKPPYDFIYDIKKPMPYANKFGEYGVEIKKINSMWKKLPVEFQQLVDPQDIGKFIDTLGREYIGGFKGNDFTVRVPLKLRKQKIKFPKKNEYTQLTRRGVPIVVMFTSVSNVRDATALVTVRYL